MTLHGNPDLLKGSEQPSEKYAQESEVLKEF